MIARPLPLPPQPAPKTGTRAGRGAVVQRRKFGVRRRYRELTGVCVSIAAATALLMVYLLLLSNVTRTSYEIAHANRERAALQDQTMRLDDKIAHLVSRDRLATLAATAGMGEPRTFLIVRLPDVARPGDHAPGLAFLSAIAGWIK